MTPTISFIIETDGTVRHIHDDEFIAMDLRLGKRRITRASHVEPDDDGNWTADMGPSRGPELGPFATRDEALTCERNWIERHDVPAVRDGR